MDSNMPNTEVVFNKYDVGRKGYIDFYDLKLALEEMGVEFHHGYIFHKMISDFQDQDGKVTFFEFAKICAERTKIPDEELDDVLDAYVAMGGEEDGGGCISSDKLIDTIKEELKMTIDIEKLIQQVDADGSGEIEFDEFKALLESSGRNPEIKTFKSWFHF
jgi:Ca2+-binding EF-hand superfamily protein